MILIFKKRAGEFAPVVWASQASASQGELMSRCWKGCSLLIIRPQIQEQQCRFCPGHAPVDQLFALQSYQRGCESTLIQSICALWATCDLEKTYTTVTWSWGVLGVVLHQSGAPGLMLWAIQSLAVLCPQQEVRHVFSGRWTLWRLLLFQLLNLSTNCLKIYMLPKKEDKLKQ